MALSPVALRDVAVSVRTIFCSASMCSIFFAASKKNAAFSPLMWRVSSSIFTLPARSMRRSFLWATSVSLCESIGVLRVSPLDDVL